MDASPLSWIAIFSRFSCLRDRSTRSAHSTALHNSFEKRKTALDDSFDKPKQPAQTASQNSNYEVKKRKAINLLRQALDLSLITTDSSSRTTAHN